MDNAHHLLRQHFPLLRKVETQKMVYFDNASTTLKPQVVIDKIMELYTEYPVNVHRAAHSLAERASYEFEKSRELVQQFFNAKEKDEIIFTRGTTEAINLVAASFGSAFIREGDEIILSQMDHHANIVPWKLLSERVGAKMKVIPLTPNGELNLEAYQNLLSQKTRLVAAVYVSNSLGTVNPIKSMIDSAHAVDAVFVVDAAQAVGHFPIDVQDLDADFLCCSGHKMYGPFGVGVLYGKKHLLEKMPPYHGGGGMIKNVSFDSISYAGLPNKFEAGTPPICSVVGLGAAILFIKKIGFDKIIAYENKLQKYAKEAFENVKDVMILGHANQCCPIFSFQMDRVHPHDVNTFLDQKGIAIRSGHHCNQPIMDYYKILASNRASLSFYNSFEEIDEFIRVLNQTKDFFK